MIESQMKHYIQAYLEAQRVEFAAIHFCHNGRPVCSSPALKAWTTRRYNTLRAFYTKHFPEDKMYQGLINRINKLNTY